MNKPKVVSITIPVLKSFLKEEKKATLSMSLHYRQGIFVTDNKKPPLLRTSEVIV